MHRTGQRNEPKRAKSWDKLGQFLPTYTTTESRENMYTELGCYPTEVPYFFLKVFPAIYFFEKPKAIILKRTYWKVNYGGILKNTMWKTK